MDNDHGWKEKAPLWTASEWIHIASRNPVQVSSKSRHRSPSYASCPRSGVCLLLMSHESSNITNSRALWPFFWRKSEPAGNASSKSIPWMTSRGLQTWTNNDLCPCRRPVVSMVTVWTGTSFSKIRLPVAALCNVSVVLGSNKSPDWFPLTKLPLAWMWWRTLSVAYCCWSLKCRDLAIKSKEVQVLLLLSASPV